VLLNQYLDALLEDPAALRRRQQDVAADLEGEPIEIDPDRAVAIGIIVNELVMNAVKYAYPDGAGPIHVDARCRRRRSRAVRSPTTASASMPRSDPRSTGMGQRIVIAMAVQARAGVERDPDHAGTRIVLRFRRVIAPATNSAS
jgi:two-component sensor histidine kinase